MLIRPLLILPPPNPIKKLDTTHRGITKKETGKSLRSIGSFVALLTERRYFEEKYRLIFQLALCCRRRRDEIVAMAAPIRKSFIAKGDTHFPELDDDL